MFSASRNDHISLILPISADSGRGRRSWWRHWNQLSRFQRNLILMLFAAVCVTLLLWLPSDVSSTEAVSGAEKVGEPVGQIQIAPLPRVNQPLDKPQQAAEPEALAAINESEPQPGDGVGAAPPQNLDALPVVAAVENVLPNNLDAPVAAAPAKNSIDPVAEPKDFKGPTNERQTAVVNAFKHAWKGYKEFAWGHDNLKPISMGSHDWFGLGLTLVDSLDTMYIMDLQEDFEEARNWVDQHLKFDINRDVNLFEVTIRVLGGLLSAYHLSGDKMFLNKAVDLGNRLLPCFDSPSGIPFSDVNLATMNAHSPKWSPDSSTSEVTTIQLEFRDLARSSGDPHYEDVVARINGIVHQLPKKDGLVPIFINANTGTFRHLTTISLGARGDSYYEYLLKQWLQTGKHADDFLITDYMASIDGVLKHLVRTTPNEHHVYVGELINSKDFNPKMDHLTCYLPGTLLLGHLNGGMPASHLRLADDLLETCYQTYMKQPTQLAAEITYFNLNGESESDMYVKSNDAHNLQRPEFVESLYYYYALTGDRKYQDMGWTIFQAFEAHTRVKSGYTSIGNVKSVLNTRPRDMMESFYLGETLKYFYLLFSDDRNEVDLTKFVFNTEAHILPIRST